MSTVIYKHGERTCEMLEAEETWGSTSHFVDVVFEALTAELAQSFWASGQDKSPGFLTPVPSILHASPTEVPIKEKHPSMQTRNEAEQWGRTKANALFALQSPKS